MSSAEIPSSTTPTRGSVEFPRTPRTTFRRRTRRGSYDRALVYSILDEALVCHVGFVFEGEPYVLPTTYARVDDQLYLHGSVASRMLRTLAQGVPVCVTVTLLDGLVLARSAFHHSMNYRSVMIFGIARDVTDRAERQRAFDALVDHMVPGRHTATRAPDAQEDKATSMLAPPITEASAKVRTGPPIDAEEDYALPYWAGVLPLKLVAQAPVPDERLPADVPTPLEVLAYRRGGQM